MEQTAAYNAFRAANAPQDGAADLKPLVGVNATPAASIAASAPAPAAGVSALNAATAAPSGAVRSFCALSEVSAAMFASQSPAEPFVTASAPSNSANAGAVANWSSLRPLSEVDTILLDILQRLLYEVMEAVIDTDMLTEDGEQQTSPGDLQATGRRLGSRQPPDIGLDVGNYLKLTDTFIRRFIKFCKCVPEFAQLKQDDQIALLKGGVMEAIVMRGAIIYDASTRRWHFHCPWFSENQVRALSVDLVRQALSSFADSVAFLDTYMVFLDSLFELTQRNRLVMLLLFLVELFSSDRVGLSNKLQVSQAQEKYLNLLRHYLESQFEHSTVRRLFPDLLLKLVDARDVASGLNRIFVQVDWSNVEPLVGEMFARFTQR